jgi:hypothetical protein
MAYGYEDEMNIYVYGELWSGLNDHYTDFELLVQFFQRTPVFW